MFKTAESANIRFRYSWTGLSDSNVYLGERRFLFLFFSKFSITLTWLVQGKLLTKMTSEKVFSHVRVVENLELENAAHDT